MVLLVAYQEELEVQEEVQVVELAQFVGEQEMSHLHHVLKEIQEEMLFLLVHLVINQGVEAVVEPLVPMDVVLRVQEVQEEMENLRRF